MMYWTFVCLCATTLVFLALNRSKKVELPSGCQLPDGPKRKPLVGNLLDIPPFHSWFQLEKWSKVFGPLYRLDLAGRNHIIVSTESIANDLLRERGTIYSSREQLPMAAQLMSDSLRPLFLPYGDVWRNTRKLMHALVNTKISESYQPIQEHESLRVLRDLIDQPQKYEVWLERYAAGLIMRLAYSKHVHTGEEDFMKRTYAVVRNVERVASPGAYLVDTFPSLMYLPSLVAPFKREGVRLHAEELDLFRSLKAEALTPNAAGPPKDNFATKWQAKRDQYDLTDDQAVYAVGTLFEAGATTTAAAMMSFLLAMTLHPTEMTLLQEEVDRVVKDRLPLFSDLANLPRVRAVAKETLRWRPVTAGGLPHMLTKDDSYTLPDGRKIFMPAGTNVHPVQWAIHREEALYPHPEEFLPDRWLSAEYPTYREPLSKYPNMQNFSAFGFGRRICPGQNVAEQSLYVLVARVAWCCDVRKRVGADGVEITPEGYDYISGFNVQPKPFEFNLRAREGREKIVERDWQREWGSITPAP